MRIFDKRNLGFGVLLGMHMLVAPGCGSIDDAATNSAGDVQTQTESLHSRRPRPSGSGGVPSGTGGASGTAAAPGGGTAGTAAVNCSICTTTQECCNAVNAGALCTFSAETCFSLDAGRQATYATYCLTVLRTTISAWETNGSTPPAVCKLP